MELINERRYGLKKAIDHCERRLENRTLRKHPTGLFRLTPAELREVLDENAEAYN